MAKLADYVESRTALVSKVKMAFTYPAIVTFVALAVIVALLTYVVPQVVGVFNQTRQKLPLLTVILIQVSDFVRVYGWVLLAGIVAAIVAFRYSLRAPTARLAFHQRLLRMPMFGRLIRGRQHGALRVDAGHPDRQRRAADPRAGSRRGDA